MARISTEQKALTDCRFPRLGRILGFDRFAALGRMQYLWNECQERGRYALTADDLNDIHPDLPAGALFAALIEAGLGREIEPGVIYIAGTRGRIEWLEDRRSRASNGGKATAEHLTEEQRKERGRRAAAARWDATKQDTKRNAKQDAYSDANAPAPALKPLSSDVRRPERKAFSEDSPEVELSTLLFSLIRQRNPNHRAPNLQTWAGHVDRMIRIDHRDPAAIRRMIEWSQADDFWQNNILSTDTLRRQFDQLVLKSRGGKSNVTKFRPEGLQGVAL